MTFAEKLVGLREAAGLTQEELSSRSGVNLATLRKMEQGATSQRINFAFLVAICQQLGTNCNAFADCEDVKAEPPKESEGRESKTKKKGKK